MTREKEHKFALPTLDLFGGERGSFGAASSVVLSSRGLRHILGIRVRPPAGIKRAQPFFQPAHAPAETSCFLGTLIARGIPVI